MITSLLNWIWMMLLLISLRASKHCFLKVGSWSFGLILVLKFYWRKKPWVPPVLLFFFCLLRTLMASICRLYSSRPAADAAPIFEAYIIQTKKKAVPLAWTTPICFPLPVSFLLLFVKPLFQPSLWPWLPAVVSFPLVPSFPHRPWLFVVLLPVQTFCSRRQWHRRSTMWQTYKRSNQRLRQGFFLWSYLLVPLWLGVE